MEIESFYQKLDPSHEEIRLLEILPSSDNDAMVQCELVTVSLQDEPSYTALSYVWGDASVTDNIVMNGHTIAVSCNLGAALRSIRRVIVAGFEKQKQEVLRQATGTGMQITFLPFRLRVDALCINQKDVPERNQQVLLMAKVYKSSTRVISWLGKGDEQTTRAFETIKATHVYMAYSLARYINLDWMQEYPQLWANTSDSTQAGRGFWEAVETIMKLPYWRRVWIIQEISFATDLVFMTADSGDCLLTWLELDMFCRFPDSIKNGQFSRPDFFSLNIWTWLSMPRPQEYKTVKMVSKLRIGIENQDKNGRPPYKMTDLIEFAGTQFHQATNPKDKIYALLGLMELDIAVDYSEATPVTEVYTYLAEKCASEGDVSILLTFSGIGWNLERMPTLPSWVPDWQAHSTSGPGSASVFEHRTGIGLFNANRNLEVTQWEIDQCKAIYVSGCVYGSVIEVLPRLENTEQKTLYELCTRLVAQAASEEDIFITPILGRLFRTFLQDTDPRHTGLQLYSSPDDTANIAKIFLFMILGGPIGTMEADLELFKPLGFDQEAESFKQFFVRQFLPWFKVDDHSSEYWWASIRTNQIDYLLGSSVIAAIRDNLTKKRLFRTSKGHIGLGPVCMETGDVVCVLDRCYFPVLLRNIDSHYVYIGGVYVMGLMQGEIKILMLQDKTSLERLEIR
jgi:hypothetical protein